MGGVIRQEVIEGMTLGIELRLTNIDPPTEEPQRTIYRDIVNLPNPVNLGMTVRYFNHDDVTLYFQITGSGVGYTFGTVNLGSLASGTDGYRNLDDFTSRAKPSAGDLPSGEKDENITLILRAYTDAGYSNLKWTYERTVGIHWINSADPSFTVDFLNNFDDGTVQGWAVAHEAGNATPAGGYPSISVVTDYVLSTPYSCLMWQRTGQGVGAAVDRWLRARLYKSFNTPNKNKVYAILDVRLSSSATGGGNPWTAVKQLWIKEGDIVRIYLGRPTDYVNENYVPANKWMRIIIPLPPNTSVQIRIVLEGSGHRDVSSGPDTYWNWYTWLDDFKIISKD